MPTKKSTTILKNGDRIVNRFKSVEMINNTILSLNLPFCILSNRAKSRLFTASERGFDYAQPDNR